MVPHDMLILFRRPAKPLLAELAAVRVVLCVYGDDVAFKARRVRGAVLTVLTLVDLFAAVSFHVLLEFELKPEASFALFTLKGQVLGVNGEDMAAQDEGVGRFKVTVSALVDLFPFVSFAVLLELRRAVKAFLAHLALVGEVLGVNGDDVPFKVAGVSALVVTVGALVSFVTLKKLCVP